MSKLPLSVVKCTSYTLEECLESYGDTIKSNHKKKEGEGSPGFEASLLGIKNMLDLTAIKNTMSLT